MVSGTYCSAFRSDAFNIVVVMFQTYVEYQSDGDSCDYLQSV